MKCEKCGADIQQGARQCLTCGHMITPVKRNMKSRAVLALIVVIMLVAGAIALFLFSKGKSYTYDQDYIYVLKNTYTSDVAKPSNEVTYTFKKEIDKQTNEWKAKYSDDEESWFYFEKETSEGMFSIQTNKEDSNKKYSWDIKYPVKKGATWETKTANYQSTLEVISTNETITTPAGTFENVIKIKIDQDNFDSGNPDETLYCYYAPSVGFVKAEADDWTTELIERKKK